MGQRIWLFPVWLTAVRINRRQDLTSRYVQVIYVANVCAVLVYMLMNGTVSKMFININILKIRLFFLGERALSVSQ